MLTKKELKQKLVKLKTLLERLKIRLASIFPLSKRTKTILIGVVVVIFIILSIPLIPAVLYEVRSPAKDSTPDYPISYPVSYTLPEEVPVKEKVYLTHGNRLYIPKIGVDSEIVEGDAEDILLEKEGVWREPDSSTPLSQTPGNMVIAGHRFQYLPPNTTTFYYLDKLKIGDEIQVYWEGKVHFYEVFDVFEVKPKEIWIRNSSDNAPELTIYTCTPIFTSTRRLVVKAREIS